MNDRPSQRSFLPSDYGLSPIERPRSESMAERADHRRGNTEYVRALLAEIARREAADELLEGEERTGGHQKNIDRLDMDSCVDDPCGREEDAMNVPDNAVSGDTAVEDAPAVKKDKVKKKAAAKKARKAAKKTARKVRKVLKAIKKKMKSIPRSEREDVPCCINLGRVLLKRLDARAKKDGLSRSKLVQRTLSKLVGLKVA